jgi:hypothetical protein
MRVPDFAGLIGTAPAAPARPLSAAEHLQAAVGYSAAMLQGASPEQGRLLLQTAVQHLAAAGVTKYAVPTPEPVPRPRDDTAARPSNMGSPPL